ncbi:MAG: IMP dehydrogenase [Bacteroidota bacterium]|nr:IMP dehydrogenase [Bacteroidota bacterium]
MLNNSNKFIGKGLTYDDVLIVPAYSEIMPRDVDLKTKLSRNIDINIPFISAAMDTVTESSLAIAIAREGGVGIIHKNMPIEAQASEVKKVKRSESGMIKEPITLHDNAIIADALEIMKAKDISGIPIVDANDILVGILTKRDLFFEKDFSKSVSKVMTTQEKLVTAKKNITLLEAEKILHKHKVEKLPVIDSDGKIKGLFTHRDIKKIKDHPFAIKDESGSLKVGAAVGINSNTLKNVKILLDAGVDVISIDSAHGHSKAVLDILKQIKKKYPNLDVIAGNVATAEGAKALADAGADAVKVGIGPGSICTTRIIAGIGMPQLSAIMECAEALKGTGIPVIADGGIKYSGDIVKAIAAGANSVMAGSLFAGAEESPGETIIYEGRKYKSYRGMGSVEAMKQGSGDRYFQDPESDIKKLVPEGIVGRVPFKGSMSEILYQYIGGLRAGMGYTGSKNIKKLQQAKFIEISTATVKESHPHDVMITKEAPNYSPK